MHEPVSPSRCVERAFACGVVRAALDAADAGRAVERAWPDDLPGGVALLAVGKAAFVMARSGAEQLARRGRCPPVPMFLTVPPEHFDAARHCLHTAEIFPCDHPLPTERNVEAARACERWAAGLPARTTLVALVSGGASAHLTLPVPPLVLGDVMLVTGQLLRAGATIGEVNTVRRACERLKGGGLARACGAGVVQNLLLSDVIGDDPAVIASGLFVENPTTPADALGVLARCGVADSAQAVGALLRAMSVERARATPALAACRARVSPVVRTTIMANNETVTTGVARFLAREGVIVAKAELSREGSAQDWARVLCDWARTVRAQAGGSPSRGHQPLAFLVGGEPTVDARSGSGVGGPSQEVALAAVGTLSTLGPAMLVTLSTDGRDGPTDAAGAIVDHTTAARARSLGLNLAEALAAHNSGPALERLGATLRTGPTGTNLNHIAVLILA